MKRSLSLRLLGLAAICLLAFLAWRVATPAKLPSAGLTVLQAGAGNAAAEPNILEALPEPVQRVMASGSDHKQTTRKWKGAESLPQNEQQSLWRAFSEARHEIHPITSYQKTLAENKDARYVASNPGQQLRARFLENGLRLLDSRSNNWSGVIGLDAPGGKPQITQDGATLQYRHAAGVTEWFENRPDGIEHGFIVREDSAMKQQARVQIPVRLEGLTAETMEGSNDLRLVNTEGRAVLTYEQLQAWDADGTELAAHMVPTTAGLEISVATAGARFPVVIDPLILSQQTKLHPDIVGSGEPSDVFAASVSISGDTALIGASKDDDHGNDSGSAYFFVRNNAVWSLQQKLTAFDGISQEHFGEAVSLSGDTALIGASQVDAVGKGKAYVYVRNGTTWSWQQTLTASDGKYGDAFGASLSLSGNTALVGAYSHDGSSLDTGAAYVFFRSGTTWTQQAIFTAAAPALSDQFGSAVSVSGDTALVGFYKDRPSGSMSGSTYVYVRSGSTWSLQQKLTASDEVASDYFGFSVSVSGDTALIGSIGDDDGGDSSGSAYVFVRSGSTWTQQRKLLAPDAAYGDQFGRSVCISNDVAVIAAEGDDGPVYGISGSVYIFARTGSAWAMEQKFSALSTVNGSYGTSISVSGETVLVAALEANGNDHGNAYVYVRNNSTWSQQQRLSAGDAATHDSFGVSVSLAGETAVIGTYKDDDNGIDTGSAYVFTRSGTVWSKQQKLIAADGAASSSFGKQVSLSGDTALIAAYGAGYVFVRNGTIWTQQQKLTASDGTSGDYSISLSGDTALIGAWSNSSNGSASGAVYVYQRSGTVWVEQQKLLPTDGKYNDHFGITVSLWNDTALIGADGDDNKGEDSGSVYVFVRSGSSWGQQKLLTASDGAAGDSFGAAVSLWGDTALIGAYGDDDQGTNSGSAYVFVRNGSAWSQQKKLLPADKQPYGYFGSAVSVSHASALVGAYGYDDYGSDSGSAYLFWRSGPNWSQQQKLTAPDSAASDNFGIAVCISDFTALIGAYLDDGLDTLGGLAVDQGSVYVYQNSNPDVDGDGLLDAYETGSGVFVSKTDAGTDPFNPDSDNDGLSDGEEVNTYRTNPHLTDSDNDHYLDATEVTEGSNPNDDSRTPKMRPRITPAKQLTFFSREGINYHIEGSLTGTAGTWTELVGPIFGTGQAVSVVVTTPPPFLRVVGSL